MAKPDLEDGYLRIAHELDAALACGGFGRDERIVLHEVFSMIFGPAKLKTFELSSSAIGERYGLPKQSINRAVTALLNSSVLVRDGLSFRFVKDYEKWTWKGGPMLTASMIKACRKAPKTAIAHVIKFVDVSENSGSSNSLTSTLKKSSETLTNNVTVIGSVNEFVDDESSNALTKVNEFVDDPHYEERAGLRIEKGENKTPLPPDGGKRASDSRTPEDQGDFDKAVALLAASMLTETVAMELSRVASLPGTLAIEGWQWLHAARVLTAPKCKKRTLDYLEGIARNATVDEAEDWGRPRNNGRAPLPTREDGLKTNPPPPADSPYRNYTRSF